MLKDSENLILEALRRKNGQTLLDLEVSTRLGINELNRAIERLVTPPAKVQIIQQQGEKSYFLTLP